MDNLTKNTDTNISGIDLTKDFLKALHINNINNKYANEKLQGHLTRKVLKKTAFDKIYTLRELFTAIGGDNGDCSLLTSYLKSEDSSHIKTFEYINRTFRRKLWSLIYPIEKGNSKRRKIVDRDLHIFDYAFYRPLQICRSFIICNYNENFDSSHNNIFCACNQTDNCEREIKVGVEEYVKSDLNGEKFSLVDLLKLHIYTELTAFINICNGNDLGDDKKNYHEAVHFIACYILGYYAKFDIDEPEFKEGIFYGDEAIQVNNIKKQQTAFNVYGLCAVAKGYKQLAYDIYYSWINRRPVGKLKGMNLSHFDMSEEKFSKIVDDEIQDRIHNNFAIVCSDIATSYKINDDNDEDKKQFFYKESVKNISEIVKKNKLSPDCYCTYGDILCENALWEDTDYISALVQYKEYEKNCKHIEKIEAYRSEMTVLLQFFMKELEKSKDVNLCITIKEYKDNYDEFWEILEKYYKTAEDYFVDKKGNDTYEKEQWEDWRQLLSIIQKNGDFIIDDNKYDNDEQKRFVFILLMIQETTMSIKEELKWKDYISNSFDTRCEDEGENKKESDSSKIIAYYTTLKNATYVFEELVQEDKNKAPRLKKDTDPDDAGTNCMTVMHAKYMNDPYEGLALLNALSKAIYEDDKIGNDNVLKKDSGNNSINFRESIYKSDFVFLKSFTESKDKLVMWNRYASDTSYGEGDSNGCFVELDNESFSTVIANNKKNNNVLKKHNTVEDDYNLYRVVYISEDKGIVDEKNPGLPDKVKKYYNLLIKLIKMLNQYLCDDDLKQNAEQDRDRVIDLVNESLEFSMKYILFLFKEDDYADERESRIVFMRKADQPELIRLVSENPEKLCINPFFQIYISKIILGPNVRNEDAWLPYFQYQLNNMWLKHPDVQKDSQIQPQHKYTIEKSKTHYRTFGDNW